jgi:hypothetical protein
VPTAVEFVGLPARVIIGKQESFGLRRTHDTDADPVGPYRVRMVDSTGHVFRHAELSDLDEILIINFGLNARGVATVEARYVEIDPSTGAQCERVITREVRPKHMDLGGQVLWYFALSRGGKSAHNRPGLERGSRSACGHL